MRSKHLLWILALNVAMLLGIGAMAQYSSSTSDLEPEHLQTHLWHIGVGLILGGLAAIIPHGRWRRWCVPHILWAGAVLALVALFVPGIGVEINYARRWLRWGGQPSAFAQLALIIALAHHCARFQGRMRECYRGFLAPAAMAGAVVGLIFMEPDWGTAILLAAVAGTMLFVAGTHWGYLVASAIVAAELLAIFLCLTPDKCQRLVCFINPEQFQDGLGWQSWASVLALGFGGCWGHPGAGLFKYQFVPEQNNDFILSRIGEEHGFGGTTLVLVNYVSLVAVGLSLAWRARDSFGHFLGVGLTFLLGYQAFINIGVATSSLPNKGIVLPFVSDGGSAMLALLVAVGLLASIARHAPDRVEVKGAAPIPIAPDSPAFKPAAPNLPRRAWWRPFLSRPARRSPFSLSQIPSEFRRPLKSRTPAP